MALRLLSKHFRSLNLIPLQQVRFAGGAAHGHHDDHHDDDHHETGPAQTPTVFDKLVQLTVVDLNGVRHTVNGVAGKSLAQALIEYGFPASYFFPNMGFYTQHIPDCHVFVPKDDWSKMPNIDPESEEAGAIKRMFRDIVQDYQRDTSYFASYIKLTPEFNGMTVGIGPIRPWVLHTEWGFGGVHNNKTPFFHRPTVDIWG